MLISIVSPELLSPQNFVPRILRVAVMRFSIMTAFAAIMLTGCTGSPDTRRVPISGYDEGIEISIQRGSGLLESDYDRVDLVDRRGKRTKLFEGQDAKTFDATYDGESRSILITYCYGIVDFQQSKAVLHALSPNSADVVAVQIINSPAVSTRLHTQVCKRS